MATTARSDLILPDILAEEVLKGFTGMNALDGSGVVTMNPGLQAGSSEVGNTVTVPFFDSIGEAEEVAENGALTPVKMTQSSETATVVRFGKAVSLGGLAKRAKSTGKDPYQIASMAILEMVRRKVDSLAIDRLVSRAVAASLVYDGSAATASVTDIIQALKGFGDELDNEELALWIMNSKPYWDAASLADSTGRALFVPAQGERLAMISGAPVRMSNKSNLLVSSTSPQQYYSLACKRGAVACWFNENVSVEITRDPLADTDVLIVNAYAVVHAYGTMPNGTKPGVSGFKSL